MLQAAQDGIDLSQVNKLLFQAVDLLVGLIQQFLVGAEPVAQLSAIFVQLLDQSQEFSTTEHSPSGRTYCLFRLAQDLDPRLELVHLLAHLLVFILLL